MAIKINGKDLQKRIINGKEVQKVMYNWVQIRPDNTSTILDFVNDANTWAYWYDTNMEYYWYVAWEWYFCRNRTYNNSAWRLVLPPNIQWVWTLSNVHLWFYVPSTSGGMWLSWYRDNFTNEDVIRYPEKRNKAIGFYEGVNAESNLVESINMTSADIWESEMDINFDYVNWRIYGNINWLNYTTSQLTQQYVDNWQDSWEHGWLAIHFSIWWQMIEQLYIRKVSITTI